MIYNPILSNMVAFWTLEGHFHVWYSLEHHMSVNIENFITQGDGNPTWPLKNNKELVIYIF